MGRSKLNVAITMGDAAGIGPEVTLKALADEKLESGQLDSEFADLKAALDQALASCQTLTRPQDEPIVTSSPEAAISLPPDLAHQTARRLQEAADLGSISDLKLIAEELTAESDSYTAISEKISQLVDDFDLEGIINLADKLESSSAA